MRIYKLDSEKQTVEEIDAPTNEEGDMVDLDFMYEQIGCRCFDVVRLDECDCIFVDDEGLLRSGIQPAFGLSSYSSPLVGNALVIGSDFQGNSKPPKITLDKLKNMVEFGFVAFGDAHYNNN
jgi:hypothetical protein